MTVYVNVDLPLTLALPLELLELVISKVCQVRRDGYREQALGVQLNTPVKISLCESEGLPNDLALPPHDLSQPGIFWIELLSQ